MHDRYVECCQILHLQPYAVHPLVREEADFSNLGDLEDDAVRCLLREVGVVENQGVENANVGQTPATFDTDSDTDSHDISCSCTKSRRYVSSFSAP